MSEEPYHLPKKSFPKEIRITSKKELDNLFAQGDSFIAYPLRVVFSKKEKTQGRDLCFMVSVSKRKFKRAVKRNRVKRLVRETFRLSRRELELKLVSEPYSVNVAFIYLKNELPDFAEINKAMHKALDTLEVKLICNEQEILQNETVVE
ncbi:MAG: ribonuclease P protein component [Dysgonamonadaceae bacterium]